MHVCKRKWSEKFPKGNELHHFKRTYSKTRNFSWYVGTACWQKQDLQSLQGWEMKAEETSVRCQCKILLTISTWYIRNMRLFTMPTPVHLILHSWNWQTRKHDLIEILGRRTSMHRNEDSGFCVFVWGKDSLRTNDTGTAIKVTQKGYTESWAMVYYLSLSLRG